MHRGNSCATYIVVSKPNFVRSGKHSVVSGHVTALIGLPKLQMFACPCTEKDVFSALFVFDHSTGFLWPHISDLLVYLGHGKTQAGTEMRILSECFVRLVFTSILTSHHCGTQVNECLGMRMFLCCQRKR